MTSFVDLPLEWISPSDGVRWEWHLFEADELVHLYRVAELGNPRLCLLRPRCVLDDPYPLDHDRPSIDLRTVIPRPDGICPRCALQVRATVPQLRTGTPDAGEFNGDLFQGGDRS